MTVRAWIKGKRYVRSERKRVRRVMREAMPDVTDEGLLERWNVRTARLASLREYAKGYHGAGMDAIVATEQVMVDETYREMFSRGLCP